MGVRCVLLRILFWGVENDEVEDEGVVWLPVEDRLEVRRGCLPPLEFKVGEGK